MANFLVQIALVSILMIVCLAQPNEQNFTIVTGMWNLGRGDFSTSERGYETFYLGYFKQLLKYNGTMIIFGDSLEQKYVNDFRPKNLLLTSTVFIKKKLKDFESYWFTKKVWNVIESKLQSQWSPIQKIRMKSVPQFGLKMYNPVVMSKHTLLNQAVKLNPFNADYHLWVDGGFTHLQTISFLEGSYFKNIFSYYQPSWIIYTNTKFDFNSFGMGYKDKESKYIPENKRPTAKVIGNTVGVRTSAASTAYHIYENILRITLQNNDMNTDQSVFILLAQRYPYFFMTFQSQLNRQFFINLKVKVEKIQTPKRTFEWKQLINTVMQIQQNFDRRPLQVSKLIEVRDHTYFFKGKVIFEGVLYSRIKILAFLMIITVLIWFFLLRHKKNK